MIKDWQRYKQIENEQRIEREKERLSLIEKLSLSCDPNKDNIDEEFDQLLNDSEQNLQEFIKKRMKEMMVRKETEVKFGTYEMLTSANDLLNIIEKTDKHITIICHILNSNLPMCKTMNGCLKCIAEQYTSIRFIGIEATTAGMSREFVSTSRSN